MASEYTQLKYPDAAPEYQADPAGTKIVLPLLRTSFDDMRQTSRYSSEFAQYQDLPPSPFVNGEVETTQEPLAHAVSLADATPSGEHMDEAQLDAVPAALPNPHPYTTPSQLPPISIPSSYRPMRKPTTGKRVSRRSSKHTYRAIDNGDQSDVDSASMYSQASAYTVHSVMSPEDPVASPSHSGPSSAPLPTPTLIAHDRNSNASTIRPGDLARAMSAGEAAAAPAVLLQRAPSEPGTDTTGELSRENTAVVAQLLKSRSRGDMPPARSASIVSHIERQGSIRPALGADGARDIRSLRALRKSRGGGSAGKMTPPVSPSNTSPPTDGL